MYYNSCIFYIIITVLKQSAKRAKIQARFCLRPWLHVSCLVVGIFMPKNSIVTKLCHLALGGPVIMPHRV